MECKACGVASEDIVVSSLLERLACISGEDPQPVKQLEITLLAPSYTPGARGAELRLVQKKPASSVSSSAKEGDASAAWTVRRGHRTDDALTG
jgi:hypothetical protein